MYWEWERGIGAREVVGAVSCQDRGVDRAGVWSQPESTELRLAVRVALKGMVVCEVKWSC